MTSVLQHATPTPVTVDTTVGGTTLAAANPLRRQLMIYAPSGAPNLFIALGTTCSSTIYTLQLVAGAYWELPTFGANVYTGALTGLSALGSAVWQVTEVTV